MAFDIKSNKNEEINVFIIGLRGYGKNYGGWETLASGLLDNWKDKNVKFYAFEKVTNITDVGIKNTNNVTRIGILETETGYSAMMRYDAKSSNFALKYIIGENIPNPIIYYLGVRIGPLLFFNKRKYKKAGIILIENPAGLEWKRKKWGFAGQLYLAISAYFMAISVDYLVCDSKAIMEYYNKLLKKKRPEKVYISYGSYVPEKLKYPNPQIVQKFYKKWDIETNKYFLILGRFVPENNYEMMLKGFISSDTKCKLIVITNYDTEIQKFHRHIIKSTKYINDDRIKMVGTIYDKDLLNYIRQNALGYIHGHSVGGTNPGLLEAMSATDVNLLYDVPFNREVGEDGAFYFNDAKSLAKLINLVTEMRLEERILLGEKAAKKMKENYSWDLIVNQYEEFFYKVMK